MTTESHGTPSDERAEVSDTTLRMMLRKIGQPSADLAVSYRTDELHAILTELLACRSGSSKDELSERMKRGADEFAAILQGTNTVSVLDDMETSLSRGEPL
jgi:hypothetical protein